MGVFDSVSVTPNSTKAGVFSTVSSTTPSKTGGVFANVNTSPAKVPVTAAPVTPAYFQGKEPSGTFVGISDEKDPFSGKPFLAFTLSGANSTTTDKTRVAPLVNPEIAAPTAKSSFQNPRMPESASQAIRTDQNATKDQQLDHRMAITLGGSNDPSNLKLISTKDNQAASSDEGAMTQAIADGKMSLFQAQAQEAKEKGLPTPFTDQPAQAGSLWDTLSKGVTNFVGGAKEIAADAATETLNLGKEGYDMWNGFLKQAVLQPYLTAVTAAGNASASVTENISNPDGTMKPINKVDWSKATANELKLVSAGLSAVADPGMVPYQVANATPGVGHVLDPLNWVFEGAGKGGAELANGFGVTTALINKLPISADDKTQLSDAIQEVGSTLGQFAVGAYLFGRAGKAVEMRGDPATPNVLKNFKDLTLGDAKDLVESTKKFAEQVKTRLPQNMQEAQRGFVRIPGLGDLPEEGDKTPPAATNEEKPEEKETQPTTKDTEKTGDIVPAVSKAPKSFADLLEQTKKYNMPLQDFIRKSGDFYDLKEPKTRALLADTYKKLSDTQRGVPRPAKGSAITSLALQQKTPKDFYLSLTPDEKTQVLDVIDPHGTGVSAESAANTFYEQAKDNIAPQDQELPQTETNDGKSTSPAARSTRQIIQDTGTRTQANPRETNSDNLDQPNHLKSSYNETIAEHNGGVNPPENKGGMQPPEIDWSKGKEIAAIRQSTDTLERTLEKIFPKKEADTLNEFLTEANRHNEAERVRFVSDLRTETQKYVVKELGIKPATVKSAWVQRLGEGRVSLDELKAALPNDWEKIGKASEYFRGKYNDLIDIWNKERDKAGLKPINKRPNYFRHFIDLTTFANMYGLDFRESALPTAISGITEFFRSQSPWTNAAMRRLGNTTTDDAVGGFDNYLDSASRAIFHTDTVQRGRLVDSYLRDAGDANANAAQDIRDSGEKKEIPPPIDLPRLANTFKQWTDTVSGKQNIFDRSFESFVGRPILAVARAITRQFGLNVIGGNVGAAVTHAIPMVYTLATVDKGAAFHGLYGTLTSPFLEDFRKVDGVQSDFLTRRFGKEEIQPTLGEKIGDTISAPFHWVDQFISRFAVESKYHEGITKGLPAGEAMKQADNYASRVIGDRSAGNLPPIMSTKTLGWLTQFQIEVNDNLRVLTHDIPRWEQGNIPRIANRIVQFAVYSYLFNQTMQYIKGSGKGLDPIDMGLTLAGLNDEGHDKTLMQRLSATGSDLLKELPFTSVFTGGQIPALGPLGQAFNDARAGSEAKALQGVLASFASPVGGGQQLQKSLTAIQAWKQGYVTDSKGNITATVPHTLPTLAQGVLFGKSAFENVKKTNSEISNLDETLKEQQAASKLKNQQADNIWKELKGMDGDAAKTQLQQIAKQDPDMAKRVIQSAKDDAANITKQDTLLKTLGVTNGERAKYIAQKLNNMDTVDEKKAYIEDLAKKKIVTAEVLKQLGPLLKK